MCPWPTASVFERRREAWVQTQSGLPFEKGAIDWDFEGRGNRTRKFCNSVTNFALQACWLNEQLDLANAALQDLCHHYLEHPHDLHESHSFHWSGAIYSRLWAFFGPGGSVAPDRLDPVTQRLMIDVMWAWASVVSPALSPDTTHLWRVPNTENHHAMGAVTAWSFSAFLRDLPSTQSRTYTDGQTPGDHYLAWSDYLKAYFRARAGKGQCVEIACNVYNGPTLHGWYNVYDFAEDPRLKQAARSFLDLYWASWAEDQIEGVRGGGKTRIYKSKSREGESGGLAKMANMYFADRSGGRFSIGEWVVATSDYRPPDLVFDLAGDLEGRGSYEVIQRCVGLADPDWRREPDPPVLPFGVTSFREDFGGILRYSYCTPDFAVGTLMLEARPPEDWSGSARQNRWQGVIFRGHRDARIVPECGVPDRTSNPRGDTYNAHWSVQKEGALVVQMLEPGLSRETEDSRVWISRAGLTDPVEMEGWVFVESAGAYAGVRVVDGGYTWDDEETGRWLTCSNNQSPAILEVARKVDFADAADFRRAVLSRSLVWEGRVLDYETVAGHTLRLYADYSRLPEIDGETVNLAPSKVYDSPHVSSEWDSGRVTLRYGGRERELDFRLEQKDDG